MSSPQTESIPPPHTEAGIAPGNTVAVIGLILTGLAACMVGVLFAAARGLPDSKSIPAESLSQEEVDGDSNDSTTPDELGDPAGAESGVADSNEGQAERQAAVAAQRLRVLLLASTTVVLNLVGLALSVTGLVIPGRPRAIAVCGTILSLILLAGVFGVMAVGALLNPLEVISSSQLSGG